MLQAAYQALKDLLTTTIEATKGIIAVVCSLSFQDLQADAYSGNLKSALARWRCPDMLKYEALPRESSAKHQR